jgi:thiosulfate/3-mercaptopyruvate sulfurtransferase
MTENKRELKPDDELVRLIEAAGVTKDKTVITTCGTGREQTNEFLIFRYYLGYPKVRGYEGSFTEWISHPENPTVTGSSPR